MRHSAAYSIDFLDTKTVLLDVKASDFDQGNS